MSVVLNAASLLSISLTNQELVKALVVFMTYAIYLVNDDVNTFVRILS